MTLVADGDVQDQIVQALQAVKYDIVTYDQLGLPIRPDKLLMERILSLGGVLVTRDTGIPSQAYLYQFAQYGLTVVVLRWKESS